MPLALGTLAPEPLQPGVAALLQPLLDLAIALGATALDLGPVRLLLAFPLRPLPLEPLGDRFPAPERNYVGVSTAEPLRRDPPPRRTSIGDAIVPGEPHAAWV